MEEFLIIPPNNVDALTIQDGMGILVLKLTVKTEEFLVYLHSNAIALLIHSGMEPIAQGKGFVQMEGNLMIKMNVYALKEPILEMVGAKQLDA